MRGFEMDQRVEDVRTGVRGWIDVDLHGHVMVAWDADGPDYLDQVHQHLKLVETPPILNDYTEGQRVQHLQTRAYGSIDVDVSGIYVVIWDEAEIQYVHEVEDYLVLVAENPR